MRTTLGALAILVSVTLGGTLALGQGWRGRAHGSVLGPDGEPLAGAQVTLRPERVAAEVGAAAAATTRTGKDGRWAAVLSAPGVWAITVEAEGFHPADGLVPVPDQGPAAEVRVELRSLDEVPPEAYEPGREGRPEPPPERPVLPPEPHREGRYRTAFTERSPLSDPGVVFGRHGGTAEDIRGTDPSLGRYELAEETFEVYVPEGYEPAGDAAPRYGLLVWVSPTSFGGVERPELQEALDAQRLLWVGANDAGNPRFTWNRVGLALDAAHAMAALYDLDPDRIYAAGYSGGGRVASTLAMVFPDAFRGAVSFFGASYFRPVPVPDRPGNRWPPAFPEPPAEVVRRLQEESRFVLLTGERDFNRAQTKAVARAMEEDGFEHVTYLEVPAATHWDFIDPEWFRRALEALGPDRSPRQVTRRWRSRAVLPREQRPLALDAPPVAGDRAVAPDDAVAGDRHREGVRCAGPSYCPRSVRGADPCGDLGVARRRARRDRAQRLPDPLLKGGAADVQGQVQAGARRLDEADHPRHDPFEVSISAHQRGAWKAVLEILHQIPGVVTEEDRAHACRALRHEDGPEGAVADGEVDPEPLASAPIVRRRHSQDLTGPLVELPCRVEAGVVDRFGHGLVSPQLVADPDRTPGSRILLRCQADRCLEDTVQVAFAVVDHSIGDGATEDNPDLALEFSAVAERRSSGLVSRSASYAYSSAGVLVVDVAQAEGLPGIDVRSWRASWAWPRYPEWGGCHG